MLRKPLVQRHKTFARLGLYSTPLLIASMLWLGSRRSGSRLDLELDWLHVDYASIESVQLFQEYLRIDTSSADGSELRGAEFLARVLEGEGIPVHVERLGERNANLWAVLEGEERDALVLHSHIDVDPIRLPEEWHEPPFGGVIRLPWIYGRGAFDMKSVAIAQLMSVLELHRSGVPLRRSVVLLATGDEESGSHLGTRWVLRQHPGLVGRFHAVLTEGGAIEAIDVERVKYWGTEFAQKRFIDLVVCDGDRDRLDALHDALRDLDERLIPRRLDPTVETFLRGYAPSRLNEAYRELLADPAALVEDRAFFRLPRYVKAMLRNEVVVYPVEADPEGGFRLKVIVHLLPGADRAEAWSDLRLDDLLGGFAYTVDEPHPIAPASPVDGPLFRQITAYLNERLPGVPAGPLFVPWSATDARFFRSRGIPSYGFSPFVILSSDAGRMSGPDERMALPAFVDGVGLYVGLVRALVT